MIRAAITRVASAACSLALLVIAAFFLARALPGGPAYAILGMKATPTAVGAVNLALGLDVPVWRQFLTYWAHLLHGDAGQSYLLHRSVAGLIGAYAANTALLYGAGLAGACVLGLAGGLLHGVFWQRWPGRVIGGLETAFYALPGFFLATLLIALFSTWLHWLPATGITDMRLSDPGPADVARHLILPASAVMLFLFAPLSRYFAQAVHTELASDYVRGAAAKGVAPAVILLRHVARNALSPFITVLGLTFPTLISATLVIESVFGYPGLGWLLWRAALRQDYPVVIGVVLVAGLTSVLASMAADLAHAWLDPRLSVRPETA